MNKSRNGNEYLLSIKDLNYSIHGNNILKAINLDFENGGLVGLVGPNGAGKTTLLKAINGVNKIDSGEILLSGKTIKTMAPKEIARAVSLMSQNTFLSFALSSSDVVMMGRYPHLGRFERESKIDYEKVSEYMEYTDTIALSEKLITEVSGGERQRILFAKTLAQEADILLLDEPTASLDISHQEQIFEFASELVSNGKLVIAAVHDLRIAAKYCSRLILMKAGEVLSDGNVDEVLNSNNLKTAYGIDALVYRNKVSGMLDFFVHNGSNQNVSLKVHVVGGGGSAAGALRLLFERGYEVTAGVFSIGDSDLEAARLFGFKHSVCLPFNEIDDEAYKANVKMIKEADLVILCSMPFGMQNIRNLEACMNAKKIILIEDESPYTRDYTGGKGIQLYNLLKERGVITNSIGLAELF